MASNIKLSDETIYETSPQKFAVNQVSKLLTPIKGEPPAISGRGRRRNPVVSEIYTTLIVNRNVWFHINIPITSKKQLASLRTSLHTRARKDGLYTSTSSMYNETTKMYDMWIMLTN